MKTVWTTSQRHNGIYACLESEAKTLALRLLLKERCAH